MRTISLIVVILTTVSFNCEAYYEGATQKDRGMRNAYLQLEKKDNEEAIGYVEQHLDYAKPSMMWGASNAAYNKKQTTRSAFFFMLVGYAFFMMNTVTPLMIKAKRKL